MNIGSIVANAMAANAKAATPKIVVEPCPTADSRSAGREPVSKDALLAASQMHISDVERGMDFFAKKLKSAGKKHDWTKITFLDAFHRQFADAQRTGVWSVGGWYDTIHLKRERHHLERVAPDNVNLVDVLEHIVDCVMAGMARNGKYKPDMLSGQVLERAYINTQRMLEKAVAVADHSGDGKAVAGKDDAVRTTEGDGADAEDGE